MRTPRSFSAWLTGRRSPAQPASPPRPLSKDDAPCCVARRLPDGRPVIGYCSPECIRRPEVIHRKSAIMRRSDGMVTR